MRRLARTALTVLLMLPLAATAVLWVRSLYAYDQIDRAPLTNTPLGFRSEEFILRGWRGVLGVSYVRHNFERPTSPHPVDSLLYTQYYNHSQRQRQRDSSPELAGLSHLH